MSSNKTGINDGNTLDPSYQNGQSDVEKLMRRHLQEPDHVITDEDLRDIEIKSSTDIATLPPQTSEESKAGDSGEPDETGPDRIVTPLDVLGS